MTASFTTGLPVRRATLVEALVPQLVLLGLVLTGALDLAAFTTALAIEATLYALLLSPERDRRGRRTMRWYCIGPPAVVALVASIRADWDLWSTLGLATAVATSAATLVLLCRAKGVVQGAVGWLGYTARVVPAILAALMLAGTTSFLMLAGTGWSHTDAGATSWLGAQLVWLGDLAGLGPETTLTVLLVLFLGFNEVLAAAWTATGPTPGPTPKRTPKRTAKRPSKRGA